MNVLQSCEEHCGFLTGFSREATTYEWRQSMNGIIYLIGLIVVVMAILSFFGLR